MFTLDNYEVKFAHKQFKGYAYNGATSCFIYDNDKRKVVGDGIAYCSRNDQFNKAVGRKIALTRALKPFDKETRTRFWDAYFKAGGKK